MGDLPWELLDMGSGEMEMEAEKTVDMSEERCRFRTTRCSGLNAPRLVRVVEQLGDEVEMMKSGCDVSVFAAGFFFARRAAVSGGV